MENNAKQEKKQSRLVKLVKAVFVHNFTYKIFAVRYLNSVKFLFRRRLPFPLGPLLPAINTLRINPIGIGFMRSCPSLRR